MLGALSRLPTWELDHREEDIRGWAVRDTAGRVLGTVDELIVDTDSQRVTQVVLADGRQFSAHDVFIGDHVLTVGERREAIAKAAPQPVRPPVPAPAPAPAYAKPRANEFGDLVIPVVDEEIDVGKRSIEAGGVRVRSHVVEKPFEQSVRLREERVNVERRPLDRALTLAEAEERLRDASMEMKALSEVPLIGKRAHVVEEIVIKKEVTERVEKVRDTVRHTDVDVTEFPSATGYKTSKKF
jgi:uncharacterized protein (TIGR02271 family)